MMSLWDALRMNMMISYQELVRTFPKNLWGKHRDSMRRPEIDGRQAFCLKRKSRFRENRLTDYRLTVDSYLKILLQQEHRQLFPTL
ncbi:Uncharacterised protein [Shigella sonnei]|nr:hypothetical protein [Salmonella enterica]SJD78400.1 Uncharacterised protein [Shigella sonnei]